MVKMFVDPKKFVVFIPLLLTSQFIPETESFVIQAILDLDNDSENLIGDLINKVDGFIDPKNVDIANATNELAFALLRLSPLISITGNITHGSHAMSVNFNFNAKAGVKDRQLAVKSDSDDDEEDDEKSDWEVLLSVFGETVRAAELWTMFVCSLVFNNVVSLVVNNVLTETALLSGAASLD